MDDQNLCTICLDILDNETEFILECKHIFHTTCIYNYILQKKINQNCPICRTPITLFNNINEQVYIKPDTPINNEISISVSNSSDIFILNNNEINYNNTRIYKQVSVIIVCCVMSICICCIITYTNAKYIFY